MMRIQTPQYPLASMCSVIIKILVYFHEKCLATWPFFKTKLKVLEVNMISHGNLRGPIQYHPPQYGLIKGLSTIGFP